VHVPSWLAWQMRQLYDRHFPAGWSSGMGEPAAWQEIQKVDPGELWETHNALKSLLLTFVRRRLSRQCRRREEGEEAVEAARNVLDPNALTIGFARRFATYKRANLFLFDVERMLELLDNRERPVQFIFSGKAHPRTNLASSSSNAWPTSGTTSDLRKRLCSLKTMTSTSAGTWCKESTCG
jgi:glycogen phosphorylase